MDKEARKLVRDQTSAKKNLSSPKQQDSRNNSARKFNRIFSNLEKSILNRFSNNSSPHASAPPSKLKQKPNLSSTAASSSSIEAVTTATSTTSSYSVLQNSKRCNEQQVQKEHNQMADTAILGNRHPIASQPSSSSAATTVTSTFAHSEPTNKSSKLTLNKYQQQVMSTMRSNHILVNNKLSIPPPHANVEARNQSHRLLFGSSTPAVADNQSYDTNGLQSPSAGSRQQSSIKDTEFKHQSDAAVDSKNSNDKIKHKQNPSPIVPAKPSPTKLGSQANAINNKLISKDDEEESGFSTYQSRRAASINSAPATPSTSTTLTKSSELLNHQANNMILMQTNQVPFNPVSFTPQQHQLLGNTFNINTHPVVYSYQSQVKPQNNFINTHQFVSNNPVPSFDPGINNSCYYNQQNQRLNHHISQHYKDQSHFHQQQQLHDIFGQNAAIPINIMDTSQQIYANAPPKPRRYQYYEPNQVVFQVPQMNSAISSTASNPVMSATTALPGTMISSNNSFIQLQPNRQGYQHLGNQHLQNTKQNVLNQPIYNMNPQSQTPNMYYGLPVSQGNNSGGFNLIPYQSNNNQQIRNLPPPLIKSKSSLDASGLSRFKQDKLQNDNSQHQYSNTLRIQRQQNQPPQPIYGTHMNQMNRCLTATSQCQQPSMLAQSLQRSKSVTQLLPDYEAHQQTNHQIHQHPREPLYDGRAVVPTTPGSKFLSVSSASTTNLNYAGLSEYNQQAPHQNDFAKLSSQLNIASQQQQQQPQYNRKYDVDVVLFRQQRGLMVAVERDEILDMLQNS